MAGAAAFLLLAFPGDVSAGTDDDGFADGDERSSNVLCPLVTGRRVTDPDFSRSPLVERSLPLTGAAIAVPDAAGELDLDTWTIECWFKPSTTSETGDIIRRTTGGQTTFALCLDGNMPYVEFSTTAGTTYEAGRTAPIPQGEWSHIAAVWDTEDYSLSLIVNGMTYQAWVVWDEDCALGAGVTQIGTGVSGRIDELRIWGAPRLPEDIDANKQVFGAGVLTLGAAPTDPDLVKCFPFDDGGVTSSEDYTDQNNHAGGIPAIGDATDFVPMDGFVDEDGDNLPDWWETAFYGDIVTVNAASDTETPTPDTVTCLYEYLCDLNPRDQDTDNDGILDGDEDFDTDGLANKYEVDKSSHPLLMDTDDDTIDDGTEFADGTDPANSLDPVSTRVLMLGGSTNDFLSIPIAHRFGNANWTIELWVCPTNGWTGDGILIDREIQEDVSSFFLKVDANLNVMAGYDVEAVTNASIPLPADGVTWTHLAASYEDATRELILYQDGIEMNRRVCTAPIRVSGVGPVLQRVGPGFEGRIDEVRVWSDARTPVELNAAMDQVLVGNEDNLVCYYRFDDGTSYDPVAVVGVSQNPDWTAGVGAVQEFATTGGLPTDDWMHNWRHGGTLHGAASMVVTLYDQYPMARDSDGDKMPNAWEYGYGLEPFLWDSQLDADADGWDNGSEYMAGTDPTDPADQPSPTISGQIIYHGSFAGDLRVYGYQDLHMGGEAVEGTVNPDGSFTITGFEEGGNVYLVAFSDDDVGTPEPGPDSPVGVPDVTPIPLEWASVGGITIHLHDRVEVPWFYPFSWEQDPGTNHVVQLIRYGVVVIVQPMGPRNFFQQFDYLDNGFPAGVPEGYYRCVVRETDLPDSTIIATNEFTIWPTNPAQPVLLTPLHYATLTDAREDMTWSLPGNTASKVRLRVRRKGETTWLFATNLFLPAVGAGATFEREFPMFFGNGIWTNDTYEWQLRGINGQASGPWSDVREFTVNVQPPPLGVSYIAGSVVYSGKATGRDNVSNIVVQIYGPAGMSGHPVYEYRFDYHRGTNAVTNLMGTFEFLGFDPTNYYLRAYIDIKHNGIRSQWEPQGYIGAADLRPIPISVAAHQTSTGHVIVIEDRDTDNDGLPDGWESYYFGHRSFVGDSDPDGDGPTSMEYASQYDLNPFSADTDGDGVWDMWHDDNTNGVWDAGEQAGEVGDGINPLSTIGTDPMDPDSDDDGLTDGEEVAVGSNPLVVDTDGDLVEDYDEVVAGTDPTDPTDFLALGVPEHKPSPSTPTNLLFTLKWHGRANVKYHIEYSRTLKSWTFLHEDYQPVDGERTFTDSVGDKKRMYRIVVVE